MEKIFTETSEKDITRTIAQMFNETLMEYSDCDVIIIGAGPAGLMADENYAKTVFKRS